MKRMNKFQNIITRLNKIVALEGKEPLDQLGSYIIGTLVIDDAAGQLCQTDETLARIADLGGDLEVSNGGEEWMKKDWQEVKQLVAKLNYDLATTQNKPQI